MVAVGVEADSGEQAMQASVTTAGTLAALAAGTAKAAGPGKLLGGTLLDRAAFLNQTMFAPMRSRHRPSVRLASSILADQCGSTLLRWFGIIPAGEMAAVFPNIGRFGGPDLGFLS